MQSRKILLLNASPQAGGHTQQILDAAAVTLDSLPNVQVVQCSFSGRTILPLSQCNSAAADDFAEIAGMWQAADGILLGAPVYTYGPPSILYTFFERLRARTADENGAANSVKPIGIISQGGAAYSGAEENAHVLQMLALSAGCVPVSGDMPGFSQAITGQVADQAAPDATLVEGAGRLAVRVVEMVSILESGRNSNPSDVRLLAVTAGSGFEENNEALVDNLFQGALKTKNLTITKDIFHFEGKAAAPCLACTQYCSKDMECVYQDAMQEYRQKWLMADAVIWLVGVNEIGIEPAVIATMDRMNQVRFETFFSRRQPQMPRYTKAMSVIAVGHQPYRISSAVRFLRQTALLYQNVIVPQELLGGCGVVIGENGQPALSRDVDKMAIALGNNSAQLAGILKSGLATLSDSLPEEYYPSTKRYGLIRGSQ